MPILPEVTARLTHYQVMTLSSFGDALDQFLSAVLDDAQIDPASRSVNVFNSVIGPDHVPNRSQSQEPSLLLAKIDNASALLRSARERIDAKLISLASQRNSLQGINKLPAELLSSIFVDAIDLDEPGLHHLKTLARVQKHWYQLIDQSPCFWTQINAKDARNIVACKLSKSGDSSLALKCEYTIDEAIVARLLSQLSSHIGRIRSLTIHRPDLIHVIPYLQRPMPLLAYVDLHSDETSVPTVVNLKNATALQHVYLDGVNLVSEEPSFSNLRTLHVINVAASLMPPSILFDALRASPNLESLFIQIQEDWRGVGEHPPLPPGDLVLPRLSDVSFRWSPVYSPILLPRLRTLSFCTLHFYGDGEHILGGVLQRPQDGPSIFHMALTNPTITTVNVNITEQQLNINASSDIKEDLVTIVVDGAGPSTFVWNAHLLPFPERSSSIDLRLYLESDALGEDGVHDRTLLHVMPGIKSLSLGPNEEVALLTIELLSRASEDGSWLCPGLETLSMTCVAASRFSADGLPSALMLNAIQLVDLRSRQPGLSASLFCFTFVVIVADAFISHSSL